MSNEKSRAMDGTLSDEHHRILDKVFELFSRENVTYENGVSVLCHALAVAGKDAKIEMVIDKSLVTVTDDPKAVEELYVKSRKLQEEQSSTTH